MTLGLVKVEEKKVQIFLWVPREVLFYHLIVLDFYLDGAPRSFAEFHIFKLFTEDVVL